MRLIDTNDNWAGLSPYADDGIIYYEDGSSRPLTTDQVVMTFGKYKGWNLSEVSDVGYLEWLVTSSVDRDDTFPEMMARMRLNELK